MLYCSAMTKPSLGFLAIIATALISGATACFAAAPATPTARLDHASLAARGKQSALLTVDAFGRYAVTASSAQGVAVQLVDRMAGAGPLMGEAGKQDGRLDLFLDRGEQKIVTYASGRGKGRVKLAAHAFRELNAKPQRLIEYRLERATLGDFEQRSYWIEIKTKRTVALEAAGRYLTDLRLWRDGTWLVDAAPQIVQSQARPEQPLSVARLSVELEPGLYLLTAYGGPSQPWTKSSDAKPFLLRFGIPKLAPAMRRQFTMGEFGVERFVVPAGPTHFRLELPTAHAATLEVADYSPKNPFQSAGPSASIDKKSLPPVAELDQSDNVDRLVTVTMAAGKSFILQHFNASSAYQFKGSGNYWASTIHTGNPEDSVGASAVLTRRPIYGYGREEYVADRSLLLEAPWHRRFNLLDRLSMFVKLPAAAKIKVVGDGASARYRFEPFLTSRPSDYREPPWQPSGHVFDLDGGLYVLSVAPQTRGILDLRLAPESGKLKQLVTKTGSLYPQSSGGKPVETVSPVMATARFPAMQLDGSYYYTLYLNSQPGVTSGVVLRPLPIDLSYSLPVAQQSGETLTIPVSVPERGTLRALAEDGRSLNIALDNGMKGSAIVVEPGSYRVTVAGGKTIQSYSLELEPTRLASSTPLPPLPDTLLAELPKFPVITPGVPQFLNLDRSSAETYEVRVDKPGLYRCETTGLLQTGGKVRTRTNPSLFAENENGVGRNFMIQRYLREGNYQLAVSTRGQTRGHLGVRVARTGIIDGGELREGEVARAQLPTGQALAYRFRIARRGSYHLQTMGLGRNFDIRLEDDQGWPVFAPIQQGDLTNELEPGNYRVIVLPQSASARVLTRLDRVAEAKIYKGHGPHRIPLGSTVGHTWVEPAKGGAREPDKWEFVLPAPAQVTIALDNEMGATLMRSANPTDIVARINAAQPWRGDLPAGRYMVRARHSRKNNYVDYTLSVSTTQLLAGQSRVVSAPASIPVSVGTDGLIELQSFGPSDVRAKLLDADGNTIAQNDDRPDDWNFHIAQRLRPGKYQLQVDPVGVEQAQTTVSMYAPAEVAEKPLVPGSEVEIKDAQVHVYPVQVAEKANVLVVDARSSDVVGLALEGESAQSWVGLGTQVGKTPYLALPIGPDRFKAYRLRAWSADQRSLRMSLRVVAAALPPVPEKNWLHGSITPVRVDEKRPDLKMAMVAIDRPGAFRLKGDFAQVPWSDSSSGATRTGSNPVISVNGKFLLLVADRGASGEAPPLSATRLRLPTDEQDSLRLNIMAGQVGSVDMQPHEKGPSLVIARARTTQPGIAVGDALDPAAMGFVPGEAVALAYPRAAPVRVWNASRAAAPIEVDLRQVPLQKRTGNAPGFGVSDGTIKARTALYLKLPGGPSRVRLTLSPMNAAVLVKQGKIISTHWAGNDALQETVVADADQLWLLNADSGETSYSLEVAPDSGKAEAALKPGELFERNAGTAGRLRIPVELPAKDGGDYHLHVRGDTQALWQENGGHIESGADISIRGSGVLWLQHQPGTLVAWIDGPQAQAIGQRIKSIRQVKPPQSVNLEGKQQVLEFNLDRVTMLHLHTRVPVVTQFLVQGQPALTEAHLYGADINLPAPAGLSRLVLRAIGADSLSGVATVTATGVTELTEGVGPEILLAPGSARLFAFDLGQPVTIGIGVRASSDVVRSVLYDEHGTVQSRGVVQMPTLVPGRYYLTVEMPADSEPVRVQPIVVGLKKPDTRPPFDILQRYVKAKEGSGGLIYVPPPPAAPDAATETAAPTADDQQGDAASGADAQQDEAPSGEGDGSEPASDSGQAPAEEKQ